LSQPGNFIRGPRPSDQSYIASTWVRQLAGTDKRNAVGARFGNHGRTVDALFDRPDTRAIVRHAPGDPDAIRAWLVYAEGPGVPLVHFCYARKQHREQGYARALLAHVGIRPDVAFVHTSTSPSGRLLLKSYPGAAFLPLAEFLA